MSVRWSRFHRNAAYSAKFQSYVHFKALSVPFFPNLRCLDLSTKAPSRYQSLKAERATC